MCVFNMLKGKQLIWGCNHFHFYNQFHFGHIADRNSWKQVNICPTVKHARAKKRKKTRYCRTWATIFLSMRKACELSRRQKKSSSPTESTFLKRERPGNLLKSAESFKVANWWTKRTGFRYSLGDGHLSSQAQAGLPLRQSPPLAAVSATVDPAEYQWAKADGI